MYLASVVRPDISFAESKLSRFDSNMGDDHWLALERVMHYRKDIASYMIHYTWYPRVLEGYSDLNEYLMLMRPQVDMCIHLEMSLFLVKVLQANHLNEVKQ